MPARVGPPPGAQRLRNRRLRMAKMKKRKYTVRAGPKAIRRVVKAVLAREAETKYVSLTNDQSF